MSNETQEKTTEAKSITTMAPVAPLALKGDSFDELFRQAKALAPSSLIPKHLRAIDKAGNEDKVATLANVTLVLAYGRELNLGPVASLSGIAVVNGRPFAESQTLAAAVRASGECLFLRRAEASSTSVTWETHRKGEPSPERRTFTMAMAQSAGLAGRDNYKAHPERMLSARALGWLLRDVYPDVTKGMGTEVEREDAAYRAEAEVMPPSFVGTTGLKDRLLKRKEEAPPEDAKTAPTPVSNAMADPSAEPPPGMRLPGQEG